ncbi:YggT family protein [Ktedonobacteria bacterium brp13]|jgi:YggT family protein|nr:YggT family protein [Ktedonobacteria bacterium brp13]
MMTPAPLPFPFVSTVINLFLSFLILAMLVRAVVSWVHFGEGSAFVRFLARMTDPFIDPARRVIGQVGVFDFSFIFAWFLLFILKILLIQALPVGW